jgi:hypothetical protein
MQVSKCKLCGDTGTVEVTKIYQNMPYKIGAYCTQCPKGMDFAYDGTKLSDKQSKYVCRPVDYYYNPEIDKVFGEIEKVIVSEREIKAAQEMLATV